MENEIVEAIIRLAENNPNDYTLGEKVRELVNSIKEDDYSFLLHERE